MERRIALVTASILPVEDEELPEIVTAARRAGFDVDVVIWDDPSVDWGSYQLALIRSTWDYFGKVEEFRDWADAAGARTRLANPAAVIRWNSDKHYLGDLAAAGVPTVPTTYLPAGRPIVLPPYEDFVVKPTVAGGAMDARRYQAGVPLAEVVSHVTALHARGATAIFQPYQTSVHTEGERSLVYFGGVFSHAIVKGAVLSPVSGVREGDAHPDARPHRPTDAEREVALGVLRAAPAMPLYARIDLVTGADGGPVVMEAELIEPNLFLDTSPGATERLIAAISAAIS